MDKKFDKFLKDFEKRAKQFKKQVLHEVSLNFKEIVQNNALMADQDYADKIQVKQIDESKEVVLVDPSFKPLDMEKYNVLYYKPLKKDFNTISVFNVLKKYQPFPDELLPIKLDIRNFKLIAREISHNEYATRVEYISKNIEVIRKELLAAKVPMAMILLAEVPLNTLTEEDLSFNVIRKELGLRHVKIPVWLPAVKEFLNGKILHDVLKKKKFADYFIATSVEELENIEHIDKDIEKDLKQFQEYLLGG